MFLLSTFFDYFLWHYTRAFYEIFHVWWNLIWFVVRFFSLPELMGSWFSPWKRMVEGRGEKWNLEDLAGYVIIGFLSRVVGALMRTIVILIGVTVLLCVIVAGFTVYVFWVAAPLAIVLLLTGGITILFL